MRVALDLKRKNFGRLHVIKRAPKVAGIRDSLWFCRCICGNKVTVRGSNLVTRGTRSCGCLRRELISDLNSKIWKTHGRSGTRIYKIWANMIGRCHNKTHRAYSNYGGRGIKVCKRWRYSFENFLVDMGECPAGFSIERINNDKGFSIERINNDKGYSLANCKWATRKEQCNNRRSTVKVKYKGISKSIAQWSLELGLNPTRTRVRIRSLRWSVKRALETPDVIKIKYRGAIKSLSEWCDILNLNCTVVEARINKYNWSVEKAFETPIRGSVCK